MEATEYSLQTLGNILNKEGIGGIIKRFSGKEIKTSKGYTGKLFEWNGNRTPEMTIEGVQLIIPLDNAREPQKIKEYLEPRWFKVKEYYFNEIFRKEHWQYARGDRRNIDLVAYVTDAGRRYLIVMVGREFDRETIRKLPEPPEDVSDWRMKDKISYQVFKGLENVLREITLAVKKISF